ncbi:MAG: hypothetical protein KIT72_18295 [Polyangiaceae bacterium]|nr:hypothetical protein [Polyangiaceae bacterium]MCW5792368.1 hypothetical protein [Polyangiaceae bacterium]
MLFKPGAKDFFGGVLGVGLFIGAVALGACSSSTEDPENPYETREGFCGAWAKAACNEKVLSSCGNPDGKEGCRANQEATCLGLVGETYVDEHAEGCIEAVEKAYSDAKLTLAEVKLLALATAPCDRLFKGARNKGQSCASHQDCDTLKGFRCIGEQSTCQVPVEVAGGGRCSAADAQCAAGFYCNGQNCVARVPLNQACLSEPCEEALICHAGTCSPRTADFASCTEHEQCASGLCDIPAGSTSGICVPRLDLGITSQTCAGLR